MNAFTRAGRAVDDFQQRRPVLAFPIAVWKRFNDDQAGNLAALIAYNGFVALFPLLLVLVTVLNIVLKNDPALHATLLNSALAQYPVIGPQIKSNLGSISGNGLPLVIGVVFLLFGARGVANAMQNALCEVWEIAQQDRPGFPLSQLWALGLVFTVGIGFVATTFISGVIGGAGHLLTGAVALIGAVLISLVLNVGVFWLGFRIATFFRVRWRDLFIGAVIAAAGLAAPPGRRRLRGQPPAAPGLRAVRHVRPRARPDRVALPAGRGDPVRGGSGRGARPTALAAGVARGRRRCRCPGSRSRRAGAVSARLRRQPSGRGASGPQATMGRGARRRLRATGRQGRPHD